MEERFGVSNGEHCVMRVDFRRRLRLWVYVDPLRRVMLDPEPEQPSKWDATPGSPSYARRTSSMSNYCSKGHWRTVCSRCANNVRSNLSASVQQLKQQMNSKIRKFIAVEVVVPNSIQESQAPSVRRIFTPDVHLISTGYNDLSRGIPHTSVSYGYLNSQRKDKYLAHAEENATATSC